MNIVDEKNSPCSEHGPADALIELGTASVETRGLPGGFTLENSGMPWRIGG